MVLERARNVRDYVPINIFNRLSREVKKAVDFRNKLWTSKLKKVSVNDNSLWKMTKVLKKQYESVPVLQTQSTTAITDRQKAYLVAEHFEQVHVIDMNNTTSQESIIDEVNHLLTQITHVMQIKLKNSLL